MQTGVLMRATHDLIVIGAGAAGLTAAGGAARLGLRVALIERDRMGGECLNTGCVPSKALLAAARRAHRYGRGPVDYASVRTSVAAAIAAIALHDSAERFEGWGVEVVRGHGVFLDERTVVVGARHLAAPRIVVAVGSRPMVPPIPGLADTPYLTNETLWALEDLPRHLLVLGGGASGLEVAQAFRRLGSAVSIIEAGAPLAREDPEAAAEVIRQLVAEGVRLRANSHASRVSATEGGISIEIEGGEPERGSHLLVAAGRTAAVERLGLDAAGVVVDPGGIRVDARRRTTNRRIFAIGDCRDGPRFTHAAGYEGSVAVMNVALGLPARADYAALPSVVFTEPELAQVGLTEAAARQHYRDVAIHVERFADNDRAIAEGRTEGFVKLVVAGRRVVGVTLAGAGVGELVLPWSLAITGKASRWAISGAMLPYPTRSEISKAVAFSSYETLIFGRWARRWARMLAWFR